MEYLSRKKVRPYREVMDKIINELKIELGDTWKFDYWLVGSARRNLVVKSESGFDLDYRILLKRMPNGYTGAKIKNTFMKALRKIIPNHLSSPEDSTNVITIPCTNSCPYKHSYDLALMEKVNESYMIIRNEKSEETNGNGPYHFVETPISKDFHKKYKMISGAAMWNDLREIYLKKKVAEHKKIKDERKISFSLLREAVNETLQKHGK